MTDLNKYLIEFLPGIWLSNTISVNDNFLKQNDDREQLLMSEDRYIELYNEGKLAQVSPFMTERISKRASLVSYSKNESKNI